MEVAARAAPDRVGTSTGLGSTEAGALGTEVSGAVGLVVEQAETTTRVPTILASLIEGWTSALHPGSQCRSVRITWPAAGGSTSDGENWQSFEGSSNHGAGVRSVG